MPRRPATPPRFDDLPLFASDAELALAIMGPEHAKDFLQVLPHFVNHHGFPKPDPLLGRRYRPAVREWLDKRWNVGMPGLPRLDGVSEQALWNTRRGRRPPGP